MAECAEGAGWHAYLHGVDWAQLSTPFHSTPPAELAAELLLSHAHRLDKVAGGWGASALWAWCFTAVTGSHRGDRAPAAGAGVWSTQMISAGAPSSGTCVPRLVKPSAQRVPVVFATALTHWMHTCCLLQVPPTAHAACWRAWPCTGRPTCAGPPAPLRAAAWQPLPG